MDGLSLLGLVCEQELQEEDTFIDVKRLKQEQSVNKLRVKDEFRIVTPMEETEYCDKVPEDELTEVLGVDPTIKDEPCEEDVIYIEEPEENEEKFFERSLRTLEKSSRAVSRHLSLENTGNFTYKIFENQFCKYSTFTGWHLQRSCGMMKINVKFQKLNMLYGSLIVRAVLVRKEDTYRHFGVDVICDNHKKDVGVESTDHVLHPASGMETSSFFDSNGERSSLCFMVGMAKPDGSLEATIGLKSMCNDSCSTCSDPTFKQTESSRDLLMVLTLESPDRSVILARRSIVIWPKAIVRPKDLNKPERRRPKGGAAKLLKKKEWIDKMKTANAAVPPSQQASAPSTSRVISQYTTPQQAPVPISIGDSSEKKFNLIMKIQTKNSIPTKQDILSSSVNFVIKNAKSSGYSKQDFMRLVSETWDICD